MQEHTLPDFSQNHCQVPRLLQVFQVGGRPEYSQTSESYATCSKGTYYFHRVVGLVVINIHCVSKKQCQVPQLLQVFQVCGRPEFSQTNESYAKCSVMCKQKYCQVELYRLQPAHNVFCCTVLCHPVCLFLCLSVSLYYCCDTN